MKITKENLKWYGRYIDNEGIRYFDFSCSGFEFCFTGKKAVCNIISDSDSWGDTNKGVVGVYVQEINSPSDYKGLSFWENMPEEMTKRFILESKNNECVLYESSEEKTVVIKILKISEDAFGYAGFNGLEIDGRQNLPTAANNTKSSPTPLKIEYIGDSITCGYGIEGVWEKDTFTTKQQRADKSYAFITAKALGAEFECCSWSGIGIISNYIDSAVNLPDTHWLMPAMWPYTDKSLSLRLGLEPEVWDESRFSPDIVVIHLGTNDSSYVRDNEERRLAYVSGLRQLMEAVHRRSPKAKIVCCLGVMGNLLCKSVNEAVELFKADFKNVTVQAVEFAVQDEKDGIAADWHPSAKTHQKIGLQLAEELKRIC